MWLTVDLLLDGDPHAERSLKDLAAACERHPLRAVRFVLAAISVMQQIRAGGAGGGRGVGDEMRRRWSGGRRRRRYGLVCRAHRRHPLVPRTDADLAPLVSEFAHSPSLAAADDSMFAAAAVAAASSGIYDEARGAIGRLRRGGLSTRRESSTWLVTLVGVVESARLLGDADLAAEAYDLLQPYADRPAMASLAVVCFGSVHHHLALAALTCGDLELAVRHFSASVAANSALGHLPALAESKRLLSDVRSRLQDDYRPDRSGHVRARGRRVARPGVRPLRRRARQHRHGIPRRTARAPGGGGLRGRPDRGHDRISGASPRRPCPDRVSGADREAQRGRSTRRTSPAMRSADVERRRSWIGCTVS